MHLSFRFHPNRHAGRHQKWWIFFKWKCNICFGTILQQLFAIAQNKCKSSFVYFSYLFLDLVGWGIYFYEKTDQVCNLAFLVSLLGRMPADPALDTAIALGVTRAGFVMCRAAAAKVLTGIQSWRIILCEITIKLFLPGCISASAIS